MQSGNFRYISLKDNDYKSYVSNLVIIRCEYFLLNATLFTLCSKAQKLGLCLCFRPIAPENMFLKKI